MYRQFSKTTLKELRRKLNHESDPAFATSVDDPMTNYNFFLAEKTRFTPTPILENSAKQKFLQKSLF